MNALRVPIFSHQTQLTRLTLLRSHFSKDENYQTPAKLRGLLNRATTGRDLYQLVAAYRPLDLPDVSSIGDASSYPNTQLTDLWDTSNLWDTPNSLLSYRLGHNESRTVDFDLAGDPYFFMQFADLGAKGGLTLQVIGIGRQENQTNKKKPLDPKISFHFGANDQEVGISQKVENSTDTNEFENKVALQTMEWSSPIDALFQLQTWKGWKQVLSKLQKQGFDEEPVLKSLSAKLKRTRGEENIIQGIMQKIIERLDDYYLTQSY